MAKKSFKKGIDSLMGDSESTPLKRGRPKVNFKEVTKTSQTGTKENETRATFIVNENQLESIKAFAYWERFSIKDIMAEAINDYLAKHKVAVSKALIAYKRKEKE